MRFVLVHSHLARRARTDRIGAPKAGAELSNYVTNRQHVLFENSCTVQQTVESHGGTPQNFAFRIRHHRAVGRVMSEPAARTSTFRAPPQA